MIKMRNLFVLFALFSMTFACTEKKSEDKTEAAEVEAEVEETALPNALTKKEKEDGWILLFDGETSEGWRGYKSDHFPSGWEVKDGTLHCKGSGRGEAGSEEGGDIIYDKPFSNFLLKMDWKISEGGNSGIFYLGQETKDHIWETAPEMQVLDNEKHPDALLGVDGNRMAGSLYDLIPAKPQNANPAGEWNSIEILVYKGTVVHKQNGKAVLEYHLWTPKWEKMVADSKFPELNPDWAKVAAEGFIGVQDHGDDVWFKNIKLKEL